MTLQAIRDDLLRLLDIERPDTAPDHAVDAVATAVNQAFQAIWAYSDEDYFRRAESTVSLTAGVNRYALASTIQTVLEARIGSSPLRPVTTRADIEHFARRFLGATSETNGTPQAFWIERQQSGSGADSASMWLMLAPTPSSALTVTLEASTEAPTYSAATLDNDSSAPAMPHAYVESILLPIARYYITLSPWFADGDRVPQIKTTAEQAFAQIGGVAPWIKEPAERKP